jgi:hypothetical protein
VLFPGEVVSAQALLLLQQTVAGGGAVTGASDSTLGTLVVLV